MNMGSRRRLLKRRTFSFADRKGRAGLSAATLHGFQDETSVRRSGATILLL